MRSLASSGSASTPQARLGQLEHLRVVGGTARRLQAAGHREVVLVSAEPREEDNACLVVARGRGRSSRGAPPSGRAVCGIVPCCPAQVRPRPRRRRVRSGRRCPTARVNSGSRCRSVRPRRQPSTRLPLKSSPVYILTPAGSRRAARSPISRRAATLMPSTLLLFLVDQRRDRIKRLREVGGAGRGHSRAKPETQPETSP